MGHEASPNSRKTNYNVRFLPIEVLEALNQHAGLNFLQWLGS
jgi:hypothetical protein